MVYCLPEHLRNRSPWIKIADRGRSSELIIITPSVFRAATTFLYTGSRVLTRFTRHCRALSFSVSPRLSRMVRTARPKRLATIQTRYQHHQAREQHRISLSAVGPKENANYFWRFHNIRSYISYSSTPEPIVTALKLSIRKNPVRARRFRQWWW
jgi:hypothetical protein